jgi:2-oxoisovalerate dehydrogenase E2 component (dihydrolipoyl transacylase)
VTDLTSRARAGKLRPEDVQGGTFTVNNPGAFGAVNSVSIINQPQAAILAMNAIVKRPTVIGDLIGIRAILNLSLSFDHRILDGAVVLRFLTLIKRRLEAYRPDTAVI